MLQPVETRQLLISSTWQPEPFSRLGTHYQRHLWRWYLPNLKHLNMFSIGGRKIGKRQYMGIYWYVLCLMDCQNLYMTYRIVPALKLYLTCFCFWSLFDLHLAQKLNKTLSCAHLVFPTGGYLGVKCPLFCFALPCSCLERFLVSSYKKP